MPAPASAVVADLIARLDRAVPGRIEGFYVVGSVAMGAFVVGRSDVDFVAIVDRDLGRAELARLRGVHARGWTSALIRDVALRRRWPFVCNGIYLRGGGLERSPLEVTPLAAQVSGRFRIAPRRGFDVNPVTWHTLARHGIAVRGPKPEQLRIRTDSAELRIWTVGNLNDYWRRWVERVRRPGLNRATVLGRRFIAGGVLGAPRLHYTIATGEVATKEAAGQYALETFEPRWRALIEDALAYWRGAPSLRPYRGHAAGRRHDAAEFVALVIDAGNALAARPEIL
jgi:predicted nucleotidyltransferase